METWILIFLILSGPEGDRPERMTSIEFSSEQRCRIAEATLKRIVKPRLDVDALVSGKEPDEGKKALVSCFAK